MRKKHGPALVLLGTLLGFMSAAWPARSQPNPPAASGPKAGVPRENANIWDWRAHQPTQGEVSSRERKAGVAPQDQQRLNKEVDQLDKQLLQESSPGQQ
ncbi:MAG: hypothetical protein JOY71_30810 [Acetobacteraceae bacterium]|nr:hypothetical protein [Acetobacteraceae bacterium]MBV8526455.1 hypothetical protein [Acetobacteraceae bacterium]